MATAKADLFEAPSETPSDVVLVSTDGVSYKLHKAALALQSELFANLFAACASNDSAEDLPTITLKTSEGSDDFEYAAVWDVALVSFYNLPDVKLADVVKNNPILARDLFKVACKYGMRKFLGGLEQVLFSRYVNGTEDSHVVAFYAAAVIHERKALAESLKLATLKAIGSKPATAGSLPLAEGFEMLQGVCESQKISLDEVRAALRAIDWNIPYLFRDSVRAAARQRLSRFLVDKS